MKFDQTSGLEIDIRSFKIGAYRSAELVGSADTFACQDRQDVRWILTNCFLAHILLYRPGGIANAIQGVAEVAQKTIIDIARE